MHRLKKLFAIAALPTLLLTFFSQVQAVLFFS